MVPFTGGAFLPTEQRHTSPIWRRLHRLYRAEWLSLDEAAELVATIWLLGGDLKLVQRFFAWGWPQVAQARRLLSHEPVIRAAEAFHEANLRALSEDDGDRVARIMFSEFKIGYGIPPKFVVDTVRARRKRGETVQAIADDYGVTIYRVLNWLNPRKPPVDRTAAFGALLQVGA